MNQEKDPRIEASGPEQEAPAGNTPAAQEAPDSAAAPESAPAAQAEMPEQEAPAAEEEAPEEEASPAEEPEEKKDGAKKKKGGAKKERASYFQSSRFRHGSVATAFSVGFVAVVVLLNILVGILGDRFPSINLDLTKAGSNTLSEESLKVVDSVGIPTEVYVLATREQVQGDQLYSDQGIRYSQVGSLLAKIAERNSRIKVEYLDLDKNPTFAADYRNDNLTTGDVVVKTDKRYRVLAYTDLFNIQYSSDYTSQQVYSNVEGALASALTAVISDKLPVVAFDSGHAEQQDMSAYQKLLQSNSFETKDFNLMTDAIPDNTQMIVLGCPTRDYTDDEIKKLSDFLSSQSLAGDRSLMITFAPAQEDLPKLSGFLQEWGIQVPAGKIVAETDSSKYLSNNPSDILSSVQSDVTLRQTSGGIPYDYGYFVTPQSRPIDLTFDSKGTRHTYSLTKSSDTCIVADETTTTTDDLPKAASNTAALSQDTVTSGDKSYKANVIAMGSSALFTDGIVNSDAFGNGTYTVDLAKYATGTADSSLNVNITAKPLNASDITMTSQLSTFFGVGVFIFLIPVLVAVFGIVVFYKRRHL